MKVLTIILMSGICLAGTTHYYATDSGFMTIEHLSKPLDFNQHWFSDCDIHTMSHEDGFKVIAFNWLRLDKGKRTTMNEFAVLARHWNPDPNGIFLKPVVIPEPNEPPADPNSFHVRFSLSSKYYHEDDCACRYCSDTMISVSVVDALLMGKQACPWCKPFFYSGD